MEFNPPLLNLSVMKNSQKVVNNFSIYFKVYINLETQYPLWAKNNRKMEYEIKIRNNNANIVEKSVGS